MNAPANLKYTKSDEWFDPESGRAGISDYAQSQLSDIVFVELLVEFVNEQANALVKGNLAYIAPLALTVFVWVALMNAIERP